jgi:hypothetical protein
MSDYQNPSWFDASGFHKGERLLYPEGWLVAQIYFRTNKYDLDANDKDVIDKIYAVYSPGFLGATRQWFRFVGYADHRHTKRYNEGLAMNRAYAVKKYLDNKFKTFNSYASEARTRGEKYAKHTRDPRVLAGDRRVDVFAPYRVQTTIRVPRIDITGTYTGPLSTKFKFQMVAGGGVGIGPLAGQAFTMNIKNSRTNTQATFTYSGAGPGIGISIMTPSRWAEHEVKDLDGKPVWMDVGDFEGEGKVGSAAVGGGAMVLIWSGPKDRGRSTKAVSVTMTGWDISVGGQVDIRGHWHRR